MNIHSYFKQLYNIKTIIFCQWVDYIVLVQEKLQPFLAVAAQALESFVASLDQDAKSQTEDHNSQEYQFILALAGTVTSKFSVKDEYFLCHFVPSFKCHLTYSFDLQR